MKYSIIAALLVATVFAEDAATRRRQLPEKADYYKPLMGESYLGCFEDAKNRDQTEYFPEAHGDPVKCFKKAMEVGY